MLNNVRHIKKFEDLYSNKRMRKNVVFCILAVFFCLGFHCFAQRAAVAEVLVDTTLHTIFFEKLDRDPPLLSVRDDFTVSKSDISKVMLNASLSESFNLKALMVTIVSDGDFMLSGELKWLFPSNCSLSMIGMTKIRNLEDGNSEATVTFLLGLDDLEKYAARLAEGDIVTLTLFSRRGATKSFQIPNSFFHCLLPDAQVG